MSQGDEPQPGFVATRRLIWLYCILWLVEGSLRKWVVPQLSMVLLFVRDPLVLVIYFYAARARIFPANGWMTTFWALCAILGLQSFVQLFTTKMPPDVLMFGFRTFVLHIPLIWIVPAVFGRKEIITLGKWMLWFAPFLAGLMVLQFDVGPEHWLNAATIKGGSQIGSAMGKIRPAGVFSFITGPIHYYELCSAIIIACFLHTKLIPRWLLAVGVVSTMVALSVSGSRGFFLNCVVIAAFGMYAGVKSGKRIGGLVGIALIIVAAFVLLSRFEVLRLGRMILEERWTSVDGMETGATGGGSAMVRRYGESFSVVAAWSGQVPLLGFGSGSTSNFAVDRTGYAPPVEGEWERVIYEMGPFTGSMYLLFRTAISLGLFATGFRALRSGNYFCLLLASASALDVLNGNVRQVTTCGYVGFVCGLCLASAKAFGTDSEESETEQPAVVDLREPLVIEGPRVRGRGRFAVGGDPVRS